MNLQNFDFRLVEKAGYRSLILVTSPSGLVPFLSFTKNDLEMRLLKIRLWKRTF